MNAPIGPIFERRATPEAGYLERKSHPLGGSVYLSRSGSIYLSANAIPAGDFFPDACNPPGTRIVNERCLIRAQDDHRVVMVCGIVLANYMVGDGMAEAFVMVSLVEQGWANQIEVANAFNQSARTLRRYQRRFEDGGLAALGRANGYPLGRRRLPASRQNLIHKLKANGHSNCEIARRMGVSETAIRKLLRHLGWKDACPFQLAMSLVDDSNPNLSAFPSRPALARSVDTNPPTGDCKSDALPPFAAERG